jgi:succinate-acetate transporter protein
VVTGVLVAAGVVIVVAVTMQAIRRRRHRDLGYMFIASLRTTGAVAAVFLFLTVTFLFLAIGAFKMSRADVAAANYNALYTFGGWLGLITALLAWYASCAEVWNSTFKRVVLPTYRMVGRH